MTDEQYAITQYWISRFRMDIADYEEAPDLATVCKMRGVHPLFARACFEASRSVLADLEQELAVEDEARRLAVIH